MRSEPGGFGARHGDAGAQPVAHRIDEGRERRLVAAPERVAERMQFARIDRGERRQHGVDALAHGQRGAADEIERARDAAVGGERGGFDSASLASRPSASAAARATSSAASGAQREPAAARADGREEAAGRVAHHQQQGLGGRLLQDFQQRVGAGGVQFVGAVDDADAPAPLARGRAEKADRAPHVIDRDLGAQLAGVAHGALQREQVGVPLRGNAADGGMIGRERKRRGAAHVRRGLIRMREHEARHAIRKRRLADAARAADQPRMRHASAAIGVEKRLLGFRLAVERNGFARMRDVALLAHDATSCTISGASPGLSRVFTADQTNSLTVAASAPALITTQRFGSRSANSR